MKQVPIPASATEGATRLSLNLGSGQALPGAPASLGLLQQQAGRFALTKERRVGPGRPTQAQEDAPK
jgi:hypothetical protein